jgi:hypothetical protein
VRKESPRDRKRLSQKVLTLLSACRYGGRFAEHGVWPVDKILDFDGFRELFQNRAVVFTDLRAVARGSWPNGSTSGSGVVTRRSGDAALNGGRRSHPHHHELNRRRQNKPRPSNRNRRSQAPSAAQPDASSGSLTKHGDGLTYLYWSVICRGKLSGTFCSR